MLGGMSDSSWSSSSLSSKARLCGLVMGKGAAAGIESIEMADSWDDEREYGSSVIEGFGAKACTPRLPVFIIPQYGASSAKPVVLPLLCPALYARLLSAPADPESRKKLLIFEIRLVL